MCAVSEPRASASGLLPQTAHFTQGPIAEYRLAIDEAARDGAPDTAVAGGVPVIAQHEKLVGFHLHLPHADIVAVVGLHVVFRQRMVVYVDLAAFDPHMVARQADHPLDVGLRSVPGELEYHRVAAFDTAQAEAVGELVDEDALLVGEAGHHTGALHFYRLVNEDDGNHRDKHREGQGADPRQGVPDTRTEGLPGQFLFQGLNGGELGAVLLGHPYTSIATL